MRDVKQTSMNKRQVAERLKRVLRVLSRLATSPADQGVFDRLPDMVCEGMAYADAGVLPGLFPVGMKAKTKNKLAVVLHEAKLAILRYWELVRTDETTGLIGLLERLEGYAKHGLAQCDLLGDDASGYTLFNRAVQAESSGQPVAPAEDDEDDEDDED